MSLKLITPASQPAVSLAEIKAHLRIDAALTDDDAALLAFAEAATLAAEQSTGRALMPQTWEITLDAFPPAFELTRVPAASVTSITYVDEDGSAQVLAPDQYLLDNADDFSPAYVIPAYAGSWPATRAQANAVRLRYVAGYPDQASVPVPIKNWIKLVVGVSDRSRDKPVEGLGYGDHMLDRYRLWIV